MAREIGISRPTIREVLNTLEGEGLLTRQRTTRVLQVTTLGDQEIREIYVARRVLELAGLEAAATAERTELYRFEETVEQMATALANGDMYALVQADSRCHSQTVAFMHSRYLTDLHENLMVKMHLTMSQVESSDERDNSELLRQHQEFCALVLARDTDAAKAHLDTRLQDAERLLLQRSSERVERLSSD